MLLSKYMICYCCLSYEFSFLIPESGKKSLISNNCRKLNYVKLSEKPRRPILMAVAAQTCKLN